MDTGQESNTLNLEARLARSCGRAGRDRMANARVTEAERQELRRAAQATGQSLSEWAREVLLREARDRKTDVVLTEIVAMRMMLNSFLRPLCCGEAMTAEDFTAQVMNIRATKQKVTQEIVQQYAAAAGKEE